MSTGRSDQPNPKWTYSPVRLYGWLAGLLLTAFGGLMCSVPVGAILGLPVVFLGLLFCLSFIVAMSATSVSDLISMPLLLAGLALLVFGRTLAPVDQIIESFRIGEEVISARGPSEAFGIPLMLTGTILVGTVTPWIRAARSLGFLRSMIAMILIQFGTTILLVGAVLTAATSELEDQPHWIWVAIPVSFAIGVGLRRRWKDAAWILVALLAGGTLPLTWFLLT